MKRTISSKIDTGRGGGRLPQAGTKTPTTPTSSGVNKASATSTRVIATEGHRPGSKTVMTPTTPGTPKLPARRVIAGKGPKDTPPLGRRGNLGNPPAGIRDATAANKNGPATKTKPLDMKGGAIRRGNGIPGGATASVLARKALSNQEVNKLAETAVVASAFSQRNPNSEDGHGGIENPETGFLPSRSVDSLTKVSKKRLVVSSKIGSVDFVAISTQTEEDENEQWKNNELRFRVHELEVALHDAEKDLVDTQIELQKMKDEKANDGFYVSPIATESKATSFSTSLLEASKDLTLCANPANGDLVDKNNELEKKLQELEEKYQERITDNLKLQAEIESKDKELSIWKAKHAELEDKLAIEKPKIEAAMSAMAEHEKDMLLVVQAAESYRLDAHVEVKSAQTEISSLNEKIIALENKLKNIASSNAVRKQGVGVQVLLDNKINKCDPKDLDDVFPIPFSSPKSFSSHDGSDKENRSSNDETESDSKVSNITTNIMRSFSTFANSRLTDLGSSGELDEDPLNPLVPFVKVSGGSKRNALLRWCQSRTVGYKFVDITNFSTSWSDGMALCALLHSYIPDKIQYDLLSPENNRHNFEVAMKAADSLSIPQILNIDDIVNNERPSWENVMNYVKEIYLKLANCDSNPIPM